MPAEQCVGDRPRLLVDLLTHEPVVAAFFGRGQVPVHVIGPYLSGLTLESGDLYAVRGDGDQLILAQLDGFASVLDERSNV